MKNFVLFLVGFCGYITIECLFRGYSFALMGVCGGIAILILDKINDRISWDLNLFIQGLIGSCIITLMELIIGSLSLLGILPVMWSYVNMPFNFMGIICLPFTIAWIFLSIFAIFVADAINYYVFDEEPRPYYHITNGIVLQFKRKGHRDVKY